MGHYSKVGHYSRWGIIFSGFWKKYYTKKKLYAKNLKNKKKVNIDNSGFKTCWPSWVGFFETLFWAISPGSFGHFCNFVCPRIFWGGALFKVGYYSKMGYYFFKISKNGALFEVGYYSKMGYYSSKYGMHDSKLSLIEI